MNLKIKIFFIFVASLLFANNSLAQVYPTKDQGSYGVYQNVPAAIHIQTKFSDGKYTFEEIIKEAQEKGIKVIIFSDTALRRWEYGIRPLENIIRRRIEHNSVFRFGIARYLKTINNLADKYPEIVFVPAVEVVPFYYWEGNFLGRDLTLHNWHKQMLVIGLAKESDYRYLPIITNYSFLPLHKGNFRGLWPIFVILLGIFAIIKSKNKFIFQNFVYMLLVVTGILLINNLQFNVSRFDAYHKDQGAKPYQDLIDYVVKKGGLIFWCHPEAKNIDRIKNVNVSTLPYKEDLVYTHDYTGSAMLFDDNRSVAKIGDIWDEVLLASCLGKMLPIWAISEVDYHGGDRDISSIQTVLLIKNPDKDEVIKALKSGKMYMKLNNRPNDFNLDKFIVTDTGMETVGFMGEDIQIATKPQIIIETSSSLFTDEPEEIRLIRNGKLIQTFNSVGSNFRIKYQDEYFSPGEKIYYRIMIKSNNDFYRIISNPIFISFVAK